MLRRILLILAVLLVVLLVVADRVGEVVAAHVLADKVQTDEHLSSRPDASIGGLPFLNQAIGGKYKDVTITARHLVTNGVPVTSLVAHLHGVHVPLSRVLHGSVHQVPVDRTDGTVLLSYADLDSYLAKQHLRVSRGSGDSVRVLGSFTVGGTTVSAGGTGTATVSHNVIHVLVSSVSATAGTVHTGLPVRIEFSVPLEALPFRIALASVRATATGVEATGSVRNLVLGS